MQQVISDLLLDIASEQNGYSIGKPWRFTEHSLVAIVPLVRVTQEPRTYRLLSEVTKEVKIKDTGHIDKVEIINRDEYPVLVKTGEVLAGSTQSRTVAVSRVLMPQEKAVLDCVCVHSSKGIISGQNMEPTVFSPREVRQRVYRGYYDHDGELLKHEDEPFRYDALLQQGVWSGVNLHSQESARGLASYAAGGLSSGEPVSLAYSTPAQDLAGRIAETQVKYKDVLKQIPKFENQVGLCLLTMSGLESLDSFNHPDSWEAICKAILGSEVDNIADISDQDDLFEFREEKAKLLIFELLRGEYEEKVAVQKDHTSTYILDAEKFVGEVVTLNDRPIHCAFLRKAS